MAELWTKFDTVTGKLKATSVAPGGFVSEAFDIGVGGASFVQLTAIIDADQTIEVSINGVDKREGATNDWTRDVGNQKILFNYTIPQNAYIKVKVYP